MVAAKEQLSNCGLLLKHWTMSIYCTALVVHLDCAPRSYAASVNNVKRPLLELYIINLSASVCAKKLSVMLYIILLCPSG